jgi:phosphoribosylaminoimidazole-succinocarboxamide synthase
MNHESLCGITFAEPHQLAQKLSEPIVTPTTKCGGGRDTNVDINYVESRLGARLARQIVEVSLRLYGMCSEYALKKGLIIADTKFEFGLDSDNHLVLADEIFTPDSSRFWSVSDYKIGSSPKSYDKQVIRDWLLQNKIDGKLQIDKIPKEIIQETECIYAQCFNILVGQCGGDILL